MRKITAQEYHNLYVPSAGMVLVQKDNLGKEYGGLAMPQSVRERAQAHAATGVIVAISPMIPEDIHDQYLYGIYQVGDRVGFSPSVPIVSSTPPDWSFENPDKEKDASCTIHIADILGVICETPEDAQEFRNRVEHVNEAAINSTITVIPPQGEVN